MPRRKIERTKRTEKWAKELGFHDLAIGVELRDDVLLMEPLGEEPGSTDYIRPYKFTLWGSEILSQYDYAERGNWGEMDEGRPVWHSLGYIKTSEFRGTKAFNDGVDIWDEADAASGDWESAASLMYGGYGASPGWPLADECMNLDMVLLENIWMEPAYRGKGVARHLFNRVLAYHDPSHLACVITCPNAEYYFNSEGESPKTMDPLAPVGRKIGDLKLGRMLESWGFEVISECPDHYILVLDDTARHIRRNGERQPRLTTSTRR